MAMYVNHHLTSNGYKTLVNLVSHHRQRDVGVTEMKKVPELIIWRVISAIVASYVIKNVGFLTMNRFNAWLPVECLATETPWNSLIELLKKNDRLIQVCAVASQETGMLLPANLPNIASAVTFLTRAYYRFVIGQESLNKIVIVSYYEKSDIQSYLNLYKNILLMKFLMIKS